MRLLRVATPSVSMDETVAFRIHTEVEIAIRRDAIVGRTESQIKTAIVKAAKQHELPEFFIHINRDGTFAMATGREPNMWPEDMPEPEP